MEGVFQVFKLRQLKIICTKKSNRLGKIVQEEGLKRGEKT